MRIIIVTRVGLKKEKVFEGFTEELFLALKPPLVPMQLMQFDGCKKGDIVSLRVFVGKWQDWTSEITKSYNNSLEIGFVDEGRVLPFFLKKWKHEHRIVERKNRTLIIDDIYYSSGSKLVDVILYIPLFMTFWYRKFIYRKFFKKNR
ncbi:MAG: hypothetical protein EA412_13620 [Chitinophagaceae bacterium]|nr:MAG: hypothetical protein EA412_13620 [Chitinophagaceae bacterium]